MGQPLLVFSPITGNRLSAQCSVAPEAFRVNDSPWQFNPWTGTSRHDGDIATDPQGRLIWEPQWGPMPAAPKADTGGGKLKGNHYYRVDVAKPISPEVEPYAAECADIIEALDMTFNEGEAFKAIWRLAAARQGRVKPGGPGPQYDADKVAHYGNRVAEHTRMKVK